MLPKSPRGAKHQVQPMNLRYQPDPLVRHVLMILHEISLIDAEASELSDATPENQLDSVADGRFIAAIHEARKSALDVLGQHMQQEARAEVAAAKQTA